MKLSCSTNAFSRYSLFEAVEKIAALGYEGVEILADVPHFYAFSTTPEDIIRLRRCLDRNGLQVANVNANTAIGYYGREFWEPLFEPSLANPDPKERQWRIDYTKKCIDMAKAIGSSNVSITSGKMVPGISPENSLELLRESLKHILDYAGACGVFLGVEYEPGLLIERYEELYALIDDFASPNLGVNLDLGHSYVLGENADEVFECLSSRIFHVHMEDIRARKHYHLIPGLGDMDFTGLLNTLERHSYNGFITFELYTYPHMAEEAARMSLEYFRNILVK